MHKAICLVGLFVLVAAAMAQPSIRAEDGVLNASSYQSDIARGSWFVVFGTKLGPASIVIAPGAPFPLELAGTKVTFTPAAGGSAIEARIWFTLDGVVAGLLPSSAAAGDYDVRVIYNGTSAPARIKVVERNFGFATVAQNGAGPAQATNANLNGGVSLVRFTSGSIAYNGLNWQYRPAYPGETLTLWGTGLGPDAQSDVNGGSSGDQTAAGNVRIIVGATEVVPLYAGRSGGSPGLDQVNFTLPANVTTGCTVNLQVRVGGRLSNAGSLAIVPSGGQQCTHPTLTQSQLHRLDLGETLTVGSLGLAKFNTRLTIPDFGSFDSSTESASGSFSRLGISEIADADFSLTQIGACSVYRRTGDQTEIQTGTVAVALNAGPQLTLNGPNVMNKAMPNQMNSYGETLYSSGFMGMGGTGSPTLTQGAYTISGTGGTDIGPFSATVNFPGSFTWTNENSVPATIARNQNLPVTWTGGGDGLVLVSGYAGTQVGGTEENPIYDVAVFTCVAQASAGNLTVPSAVLQQLPQVSADLSSGAIGSLSVMASPDPSKGQGVFSAPLTAGGSIDFGYFSYVVGTSKGVGFN